MTELTVAVDGEVFNGPNALKVYKVTFGDDGESPDVVVGAAATYELANLPAGFMVTDVLVMVKTAFTASVTLTIGDGGDADGFLTSAHIAPQTDDDTADIPA